MRRFKVTYHPDNGSDETSEVFVVADKESKALKAFHLKVPGIYESHVVSIDPATYAEKANHQSTKTGVGDTQGDDTALNSGVTDSTYVAQQSQSSPVLGIIGIILMIVGGLILVDPTVDAGALVDQTMETEMKVANIHLLIAGQTITLVGAIFVAVQWRPRQTH